MNGRFSLHQFIVFCFGLLTFLKTRKHKKIELEKSQLREMSANKEAEVQMDLSLVGFVFVPHMKGEALMCAVSTLRSGTLSTAGHSRVKYNLDPPCGFISSFGFLVTNFQPCHTGQHLLDAVSCPFAPELCS